MTAKEAGRLPASDFTVLSLFKDGGEIISLLKKKMNATVGQLMAKAAFAQKTGSHSKTKKKHFVVPILRSVNLQHNLSLCMSKIE